MGEKKKKKKKQEGLANGQPFMNSPGYNPRYLSLFLFCI